MAIEVEVKYALGHTYKFKYELSDLFCPNCGQRTVWVEQSVGDYYEGPNHLCRKCNYKFSLPRLDHANDEDKQIIEQITKKIT